MRLLLAPGVGCMGMPLCRLYFGGRSPLVTALGQFGLEPQYLVFNSSTDCGFSLIPATYIIIKVLIMIINNDY